MVSRDHLSDDELVAWFVEMAAAAADAYPDTPTEVAYGSHPLQVIDLWGDPAAPVWIVWIHGGYFAEEYDRSVNEPTARLLAAAGFAVANIEYRRAESADGPAQTIADVREAVAWVVDHAPDSATVIVAGHSAGGFLAIAGGTVPGVAALVPLAPVTYLRRTAEGGWDEGAIERWIGAGPADDESLWSSVELPALGIPRVPIRIVHGADDRVVPIALTREFLDAHLVGTDLDAAVMEIPGAGHFEFLDPFSSEADQVVTVLRDISG